MAADSAAKLFGTGVLAMLVLAVVILFAASAATPVAAPRVPERVSDLPLSPHAQAKHWDETWHAGNLPNTWDDDGCIRKQVSFCPTKNRMKLLCEVEPESWAGIVITFNTAPPTIVTAFEGVEMGGLYWWFTDIRDGCFPVTIP